MSTISGTSSTTSIQPSTQVTVAQGTGALASTAALLAQESSIVSLIVGSGGMDALGLYNSLATAGAPPDPSTAGSTATSSLDGAIAASLAAATPPQPGQLSSSAAQSGGFDVNANFASALKTDPSLAYTAIADSFAQGIVSTLSVSA